ncbi:MAG: RsmE family RNA methyltransferase [Verrucomicrobia bacterium]|jgi:16S rRNA (uracil1498-N3)-methyltransferase|nr:RsmE family RNA methyltransferase [Verrucomicrobiota bacterium]
MLRVFCANWSPGDGSEPALNREERHHFCKVRRARAGEKVDVLNGRGAVACCEHDGQGNLEVRAVREFPPPPVTRLCVALPKGKVFPAILQKAVELGATEIVPLRSEHALVPSGRLGTKSERWQSILIEALKQSGNPYLPALTEACPPAAALEREPLQSVRICAALALEREPFWKVLGQLPSTVPLSFYVGPEGDFSESEYGLLRDAGCRFVDLGPLVLRVETAASLLLGATRLRRLAG